MQTKTDILILPLLCIFTALLAIGLSFQDPFWSIITVVVLYTEKAIHPLQKAFMRVVGTVVGALVGLVICSFFSDDSFLRLMSIFMVTTIGTLFNQISRFSYAWIFWTLTAFMVILSSFAGPTYAVHAAMWRSIEIILGVLVMAGHSLLAPQKLWFKFTRPEFDNIVWERSIKTSVACLITSIILVESHWYAGIVGVTSAFIVSSQQTYKNIVSKGVERLIGSVVGVVVGLLTIVVYFHSFDAILLLLFFATLIYSVLHFSHRAYNYAKLQAIVAFLITILPVHNMLTSDISQAVSRASGVLLGVVIALCVNCLLWPKLNQSKQQPI